MLKTYHHVAPGKVSSLCQSSFSKFEDLHWAEERCISYSGFDHIKHTFTVILLINIQKGIKIFVFLPSHVIISIFRVSIQSTGEASNHQKNRLDTYQLTGILNDRPKYTSINSLGRTFKELALTSLSSHVLHHICFQVEKSTCFTWEVRIRVYGWLDPLPDSSMEGWPIGKLCQRFNE